MVDVDPREVGTSEQVVFCALQDGSFEMFDLRTKRAVYRSPTGPSGARSALETLAFTPQRTLLATGSASGLVSVYDIRTLENAPVVSFRRNEASVEDLTFVTFSESSPNSGLANIGLAVATEDGLPYVAEIHSQGPEVRAELVGTDCDAVRFVRALGRDVWIASDDGVVRCYNEQ